MRNFTILLIIFAAIILYGNNNTTIYTPKKQLHEVKNNYGNPIPTNLYLNISGTDKYAKYLNYKKKIIYFAYTNCPIGQKRKNDIKQILHKYKLNSYYYFYPDLKNIGSSEIINISNKVQIYLYENCTKNICIINPTKKHIVFVEPNKKLLTEQLNFLKSW